ncbi:MAG: NAD(P)H-quinone oxidoreductase [Pseudomonadota bacterium]
MNAKLMRAIEIEKPGGPEVLRIVETPVPEPASHEILIKVAFAGVNRPDVLQREGAYPAPKDASPLPGLEVSGAVSGVGAAVKQWTVGDQVCALVPGGGYAEFCKVRADHVLPLQSGFSLRDAACLPETILTVWHNVFQRGALSGGQWFLVHGGSSGIGTTAIQLAKSFGARVITTAGTDEKCKACRQLGADAAINYRQQDFVEAVKDITGGHGADVILDMVAGDYVSRNYRAAAMDGTIVQIAFLSGSKVAANFVPLMTKRLTHTGSTLRARSDAFKASLVRDVEKHVWPLIESGSFNVVNDSVFPLAQAADAHRRMESGEHIGKIVLEVA